MASSAASRPSGTATQTQTQRPATTSTQTTTAPRQPVLHLRGATREEEAEASSRRPRIQWAEDVVDNEGLGRKKSKVCCIYHAPKGIDESSDESSSDSSSDESDSGDDGAARSSRGAKKECGHGDGHGDGHGHDHGKGKGKGRARARSPNAYEKVPKVKPKEKE